MEGLYIQDPRCIIPLIGIGEDVAGRQLLITGVSGPNSKAHGPKEFLHIDYAKRLTCCLALGVAKCSYGVRWQL
jgi:hypothetical protein